MRKDFGSKPLSYPQAVYIIGTYDENGVPDAMNAAWGGISDDNEFMLCLSKGHKTVKNLLGTGAFTVSMGDADHIKQCDYVGVESGNKVPDKLEKAGFTVTRSTLVNAPVINELAVCIECTVKKYDPETGMLLGKIVNVSVDENCMMDGRVDITKVRPVIFDPFNSAYHVVGEKVGNAFKDGLELK